MVTTDCIIHRDEQLGWWIKSVPHKRRHKRWSGDFCPSHSQQKPPTVAPSLTLGSDRHQLHSFAGDEVKCFVNVGDLVDSHLASLRFGQTFAWKGTKARGHTFCSAQCWHVSNYFYSNTAQYFSKVFQILWPNLCIPTWSSIINTSVKMFLHLIWLMKRCLPEMTSSSSISFSPSRKSSSMFSICVPAFLRWELHQAVNVCRDGRRRNPQLGSTAVQIITVSRWGSLVLVAPGDFWGYLNSPVEWTDQTWLTSLQARNNSQLLQWTSVRSSTQVLVFWWCCSQTDEPP